LRTHQDNGRAAAGACLAMVCSSPSHWRHISSILIAVEAARRERGALPAKMDLRSSRL
jgi:hypothetical protein